MEMAGDRPMVTVVRAHRFVLNEKANLEWIDVVKLEDGEVWSRALRRPDHEDPVTGDRMVWRPIPYSTYEEAVAGRWDFEERTGHLVNHEEIVSGRSVEPGPTTRERRV